MPEKMVVRFGHPLLVLDCKGCSHHLAHCSKIKPARNKKKNSHNLKTPPFWHGSAVKSASPLDDKAVLILKVGKKLPIS